MKSKKVARDENNGEIIDVLKKELEKLKRENSELKQKNENMIVSMEDIDFEELFVSNMKWLFCNYIVFLHQ